MLRHWIILIACLAWACDDTTSADVGVAASDAVARDDAAQLDAAPADAAEAGDMNTQRDAAVADAEPMDAAADAAPDVAVDASEPSPCVVPACDGAPPQPGPERDWRHGIASPVIVATGFANHRGRDLFLSADGPQWVLAKFAYGVIDKDLTDEEIDIFLQRHCDGEWVQLGTAITTDDDTHPTVMGVEDTGGRIYFEIPEADRLEVGRHRVHLVVAGDHSTADLVLEVLEPGTALFVTDIDGTLTTSANAEFTALLQGELPEPIENSAAALQLLAARGYRPLYLSARPEWLTGRSREFLAANGYPPGIVQTTTTKTGEPGDGAAVFKSGVLSALVERDLAPQYGFGDKGTDALAFFEAGIPAENRILINLDGPDHGGREIDGYAELLDGFEALPSVCE